MTVDPFRSDLPAPRSSVPAPPARVMSWVVDWAVVAAWLGVLAGAGFAIRTMIDLPPQPTPPGGGQLLAADAAVSAATVVPYVAYLALSESSARQATLGKQVVGLVVVADDARGAGIARIWARNLAKALPWQLAHLGVSRGIYDVQIPAAITFSTLGTLLGAACAVPALLGRRGLHDVLAGTKVVGQPAR